MSHFYRGELGRIMVWRQRLDMTTNWAITSSTAIITIAFSTRDVPHIIFFFNLAIVAVLLWIEARRYRFYDAFRARVRMLEAHFLVPMVMENRELLQGEWKKLVCEDLILPCFKITQTGSNRAPDETQLHVHFHPDLDRVADERSFCTPASRSTMSYRFIGRCASGTSRRGLWRWFSWARLSLSFPSPFTSANVPPAKSPSSARTARSGAFKACGRDSNRATTNS